VPKDVAAGALLLRRLVVKGGGALRIAVTGGPGVPQLPGKLWNWLLYVTVGYGYRTWLAGLWLVGLLSVGALVFDRAYPTHMGGGQPTHTAVPPGRLHPRRAVTGRGPRPTGRLDPPGRNLGHVVGVDRRGVGAHHRGGCWPDQDSQT
jgi:hypothetical protein